MADDLPDGTVHLSEAVVQIDHSTDGGITVVTLRRQAGDVKEVREGQNMKQKSAQNELTN